jgi:hypothetical protein
MGIITAPSFIGTSTTTSTFAGTLEASKAIFTSTTTRVQFLGGANTSVLGGYYLNNYPVITATGTLLSTTINYYGFGARATTTASVTGQRNIFFGSNAGLSLATGNDNLFFGHDAGVFFNGGTGNVFMGNYAGRSGGGSGYSVFIGYEAGYNTVTALNNTYLGYRAGYGNTSGRYNTAIGENAGSSGGAGWYNTFIGSNAGSFSDPCCSALVKAVAIGYNAKVALSNSLVLGGTGVDAVKVGIGTTTPGQELTVIGNGQFTAVGSAAMANDLRITAEGILTTNTSDANLKDNVLTLDSSTLDKVLQLNPVSFTWKNDDSGDRDFGFIAQEVNKLFPETVFQNKTDGYYGINYSRFPAILTKAIQELNAKVDALGSTTISVNSSVEDNGQSPFSPGAGIVTRFENGSGTCDVNPTTSSLSCSADSRLKKNIESLSSASVLNKLLSLRPVDFNWLTESNGSDTHAGFIAQEVQTLFPDLVSSDSSGYLSLSYSGFVPYLVQSIQQQQLQINALQNLLASSTLSTSTLDIAPDTILTTISNWFAEKIESALGIFQKLIVGSKEKPIGITLYDTSTGDPYCLKITNGQTVTENGECVVQIIESIPQDPVSTSTPTISEIISTTTDILASTTEEISASTKEEVQIDIESNVITEDPEPETDISTTTP